LGRLREKDHFTRKEEFHGKEEKETVNQEGDRQDNQESGGS